MAITIGIRSPNLAIALSFNDLELWPIIHNLHECLDQIIHCAFVETKYLCHGLLKSLVVDWLCKVPCWHLCTCMVMSNLKRWKKYDDCNRLQIIVVMFGIWTMDMPNLIVKTILELYAITSTSIPYLEIPHTCAWSVHSSLKWRRYGDGSPTIYHWMVG